MTTEQKDRIEFELTELNNRIVYAEKMMDKSERGGDWIMFDEFDSRRASAQIRLDAMLTVLSILGYRARWSNTEPVKILP